MAELQSRIFSLVEQKFGIKLHAHQLKRVYHDLDRLKQSLNIDENELINQFNQHNEMVSNAVVDAVTIQESYFFRDQSLFNLLREEYFPALIQEKIKKNDFTFRVWSAGCSRGEEIYSVALLLNELI